MIKFLNGKTRGNKGRLLILSFGFLLATAGTGRGQCLNVDLQAVSIDPSSLTISPKGTIQVVVVMKNNGPCPIPKGEARFTVTFADKFVEPASPLKVVDNCSPGRWTLFNKNEAGGFHTLTFKNDGGPIPPGGADCSMQFNISGKGIDTTEPIQLTLRSSLTGSATTGDVNGTNQFVNAQLKISSGKPEKPVAVEPVKTIVPVAPVVSVDLNIKADNCNALLNWKTVPENSAESFEVEYGTNESKFTKVGTVSGMLNDAGSLYKYINDQGNGRGYYRLKINGKDGKSTYSKTVSVDTKCIIKKGF